MTPLAFAFGITALASLLAQTDSNGAGAAPIINTCLLIFLTFVTYILGQKSKREAEAAKQQAERNRERMENGYPDKIADAIVQRIEDHGDVLVIERRKRSRD